MKCRQCGHLNEEGARFCEKCGQPLIEQNRPVTAKKKLSLKWILPFFFILIVAAGVGIVLLMTRSPDTKNYTMMLDQADRYLVDMDYAQAEASYLEAIQIDKKQVEPYEKLTQLYLAQEDYPQALDIIQKAVSNVEDEAAIDPIYAFVRYMNEDIIMTNGQVKQGEYKADYVYQEGYPITGYVENVTGLVTSDIRDYDQDGQVELLVVSIEGELEDNLLMISMYEYQDHTVTLTDQYSIGCVLGGDDKETFGLYIKNYNDIPYLFGRLDKTMDFAAEGTQSQHFVLNYVENKFVPYVQMETNKPYLANETDIANYQEAANRLEAIGLYDSAKQTYDNSGEYFEIVLGDHADDTLLTIKGERENKNVPYVTDISLEACGKVNYRLAIYVSVPEQTQEALYQPVLDAYYHALNEESISVNPLILNNLTYDLLVNQKADDLYYHFIDMDGNGIEELILAKVDGFIIDVWTYDGVGLRDLQIQGQMLDDYTIRAAMSDGSYVFYSLNQDGYELGIVSELKSMQGQYFLRENSAKWVTISEEDYLNRLSDDKLLALEWVSIKSDYEPKTQAPTYDKTQMLAELESLDEKTNDLMNSATSTIDMISSSKQATEWWETKMNEMIALLKQGMNETQSEAFDYEQAEWEIEKEEIASNASSEYEGGSMSGIALSSARLEQTRKRTFELYNRLP